MPSVTACRLLFNSQTSQTDELDRMTTTITYEVVTDAVMGHKALKAAAESSSPHALPAYGATYSYQGDTDSSIYLLSRQVSPKSDTGTQKYYHVACTYSPPPDGDITIFEPDPLQRSPIVWFDREGYTRIVERDIFGNPLTNSAGVVFDTPYEEEDIRTVLVVEFNVGGLTAQGGALSGLAQCGGYARFLRNAVNSSTWTVLGMQFPPRTVLAREVASTPPIVQGAYTYYHLSFRFVFANGGSTTSPNDPSTWDVSFLNRGYQALRVPNQQGSLYDIGVPEPKLLATDGTVLPDNAIGTFKSYRLKREVDFNLLPFSG